MTLQIDINTLIVTIVAAILIGLFWRIFNIPDTYMSKKECDRRRDGDSQAIQNINESVKEVHARVDEIYHHIINKNGAKP